MRLVAAVLLLTLQLLAQTKRFDYKGAIPGVTTLEQCKAQLEEQYAKDKAAEGINDPLPHVTDYVYEPECHAEESNTAVCHRMGAYYYFIGGVLAYIQVQVGDEAPDYERALIAKFGKPTSSTQRILRNAFGAAWTSYRTFWISGKSMISLVTNDPSIRDGFLTYSDQDLYRKYTAASKKKPDI